MQQKNRVCRISYCDAPLVDFFLKDIGFGNVKTVGISFTTSIQNKSAKKY
jgi:hypothetical protein